MDVTDYNNLKSGTSSLVVEGNDSAEHDQTVFVIDDDVMGRDSVQALVTSMGLECETFSNAEEFLRECPSTAAGCIVVDVMMPGMSGLELQQQVAEIGFVLPVIVISAFASPSTAVQAMQQGAITFLEKPCNNHELYSAIREALELDREMRAANSRKREVESRLKSLTPDERQVLMCILHGKSNKATAHELGISVRTVESRRHNVFEKLQADSVANLVRMVLLDGQLDDWP